MLLGGFFVVVGLILAGLFVGAGCQEALSFGHIFLIVLGQMSTGPGYLEMSDISPGDQSTTCMGVGFISALTALCLDVFILSITVRKFMKPKGACLFSKQMVFNTRNGVPHLQFRLVNMRGNFVDDVRVLASWNQHVTTNEGESHVSTTRIHFSGPTLAKGPVVYSHRLCPQSPMYESYKKTGETSGTLVVQVCLSHHGQVLGWLTAVRMSCRDGCWYVH